MFEAKARAINGKCKKLSLRAYEIITDSISIPQKDLIVLNDVHRVFAIDALASSHPLSSKEEEIQRPEQISEMFDTISYSKVLWELFSTLTVMSNNEQHTDYMWFFW